MSPVLLGIVGARIAAALLKLDPKGRRGPDSYVGTWALVVWFVLVPLGVGLLGGIALVWPLVPIVAIVLLTYPWPISRALLVPRGLARAAYWLTYTSDFVFHRDRTGGAALACAWALGRQAKLDEETAEWLAARLAAEAPLRGAGVCASGLLLAARGDREGACAVLSLVEGIDDRACPPAARRVANAFLASDAAERGAWPRAAELGLTLGRGGRVGWLLSAIAQSLLLEPMSPGKLGLWLRWALAPRRAATRPMVERAARALDGAFIEPEDEPPLAPSGPSSPDALRAALSLHAAVLVRPGAARRPEDVRAVAQAWDAALADGAAERLVDARARALGASGGAATLGRMRDAVEEDLAAVVLASGMRLADLGDRGAMTTRVRVLLRDRMLSEVEVAADTIRRRVDERRALPPADEWREWANLTALYERGVETAGADFRRLSFAKVYPDATTFAVWLFNDRNQRPLGNAVFRWLLVEAEVLDDTRAVTLQTKNVSCGV